MTIIAELGINHDGNFDKAKLMILAAKAAGVTIVKFQYYDPMKLLGKDSPYLEYATQCQFTKEQHERLKEYCDVLGMEYLVSVFDIADIPWADSLCKRHKVASRMNQNEAFINELRETGKEVIISTQSTQPEPMHNVRYMYCVTKYPTPSEDLMDVEYSKYLGISSHCPDINPTLKAIVNGAQVVEHHVCLSREEEGCDKPASITFGELKELVKEANALQTAQ